MRIVRRAMERVVRDEAEGTLVHVGLAQQHGARRPQPGHRMRVLARDDRATPHAGTRGHAGDVEIVLDGDRQPVEAADDAVPPAAIRRQGLLLDQRHAVVDVGIDTGVEALHRALVHVGKGLGLDPSYG
jgi:hypothetical protein